MAAKQIPIATLATIPLSILDEDLYQPRTAFDTHALEQLTESIRAEGVKVPLHVVDMGTGRYQIKCGARRKRAALAAGLDAVPCLVLAPEAALSTVVDQILENSLRAELTPHDDAAALLLIWLGRQIHAFGGDPNPPHGTISERLDALSERLCTLAEIPDLDTYTASGTIRVSWREVLISVGRGDWSDDRRKKHLRALKHLNGKVLDAIAGEPISAATVQALAALPRDEQTAILTHAQAKAGSLGEELRQAVASKKGKKPSHDEEAQADDLDPIEKPPKPAFVPDPSLAFLTKGGGSAPNLVTDRAAPQRGTPPPTNHDTWPQDAFFVLQSGLEALQTTLEDARGRTFTVAQAERIQAQWDTLCERMRSAFPEVA
jgi:ParB-like chromosome segregation protein Spo0J